MEGDGGWRRGGRWGGIRQCDSEGQSPRNESSSELLAGSSDLLAKPLETISKFYVNDPQLTGRSFDGMFPFVCVVF